MRNMKKTILIGSTIAIILIILASLSTRVLAQNSYYESECSKDFDHTIYINKSVDPPGQLINRIARLIYGILLLIFMYLPF